MIRFRNKKGRYDPEMCVKQSCYYESTLQNTFMMPNFTAQKLELIQNFHGKMYHQDPLYLDKVNEISC